MTKKELSKFLYDNFYDKINDMIDLSCLSFLPYECSVCIDFMSVNGNLYQSGQQVKGNLYQQSQEVKGKIYE